MEKIWDIRLYRSKYKWKVMIKGLSKEVIGEGSSPQKAYLDATNKLILKPWLVNQGEYEGWYYVS